MHSQELLDPDVAAPQEAPAVESVYFVFRLGALVYALPPGVVELVAPEQSPVPVPSVPTHVRGVVYVRGRIAAVVDLTMLLGIDAVLGTDPAARRLILVNVDGVPFAFVADETMGLWSCAGRPPAAEAADRPVCARFERGGQAVAVLDPVGLMRRASGSADGTGGF